MAVALEGWFAHRLRGAEGKDGNPMQEVRRLALVVTPNASCFPTDHSLKWRAEASITGYHPGAILKLSAPVVSRLAAACLHTVQAKFAKAWTALTFGCGRCVKHPSPHGLYAQKNYAEHTDKPRETYSTKRLVSRH